MWDLLFLSPDNYLLNLSLLLKNFAHFRLLILCLLDNKGVFQIVVDFTCSNKHGEGILNPDKIVVSRVAQLLTSVPDKARLGASAALTSPYPFPPWSILYFTRQLIINLNISFLPYSMSCCSTPTDCKKQIGSKLFLPFISAVCHFQTQIMFF